MKFLFGAATAAHQIEGNNVHSDWWHYEGKSTGGVSSGLACNTYLLFKEDRKCLQEMSCNSYRFSIEWSRIEPSENQFDQQALDHYLDVIRDLRKYNIEPIVTLHHFTNPYWLEKLYQGWENKKAIDFFERYLKFIIPRLKKLNVKYYITINEPNLFVLGKYLGGAWHPYKRNTFTTLRVYNNLAEAHKRAYRLIKDYQPEAYVAPAIQNMLLYPLHGILYPLNKLLVDILYFLSNHYFYRKIKNHYDFLGLNFYSRFYLGLDFKRYGLFKTRPDVVMGDEQMYIQKPEDLKEILHKMKKYNKPIMITENGFSTNDDPQRAKYMRAIFKVMKTAVNGGVNLIGYQHWSLLDNFEWAFAWKHKFGLYAFDPKTFKRIAKPSSKVYKELIEEWK